MIADAADYDRDSTAKCYHYPTTVVCIITYASDWPALPPPLLTRPKRRVPFYRPLFEQRAPRTIKPICPRIVRPAWSPRMGRFEARPVFRHP